MANFLYNGVELPDINTVWTDKETYPYATITISDTTAESEGAGLDFIVPLYTVTLFNQEPFYYSSMDALGFNANWSTVVYAVILDSAWCEAFNNAVGQEVIIPGVWIEYGGDTDRDYTNNFSPVNGLHWTSHDIINTTDNTVYLAASAPLRVDSKLQISVGGGANGDGYALYNGVKLPNIDSVWTDKETYPYAVVASVSGVSYLVTSQLQMSYVIVNDTPTLYGSGLVAYIYDPEGLLGEGNITEWTEPFLLGSQVELPGFPLIWCNVDEGW